jgi:hypothetical protein
VQEAQDNKVKEVQVVHRVLPDSLGLRDNKDK